MRLKTAKFLTGYSCNNYCRFCGDRAYRGMPVKTTQEIIREIKEAKKSGAVDAFFAGGEVTIRPDFFYLLKFAKNIGFQNITLTTNGRLFSYEYFTRRAVEAGISRIIFTINGHNAKLHDYLSQVEGSFKHLKKGIVNLRKFGFDNIGTNTVVVKQNYKYLYDIGRLIYRSGIKTACLIYVSSPHDFYKYTPHISTAAYYIRKFLDIGRLDDEICYAALNVPCLCYFGGYLKQISGTIEENECSFKGVSRLISKNKIEQYENIESKKIINRIKIRKCLFCKIADKCKGVWDIYLKYYGDREIKPIK